MLIRSLIFVIASASSFSAEYSAKELREKFLPRLGGYDLVENSSDECKSRLNLSSHNGKVRAYYYSDGFRKLFDRNYISLELPDTSFTNKCKFFRKDDDSRQKRFSVWCRQGLIIPNFWRDNIDAIGFVECRAGDGIFGKRNKTACNPIPWIKSPRTLKGFFGKIDDDTFRLTTQRGYLIIPNKIVSCTYKAQYPR